MEKYEQCVPVHVEEQVDNFVQSLLIAQHPIVLFHSIHVQLMFVRTGHNITLKFLLCDQTLHRRADTGVNTFMLAFAAIPTCRELARALDFALSFSKKLA